MYMYMYIYIHIQADHVFYDILTVTETGLNNPYLYVPKCAFGSANMMNTSNKTHTHTAQA